MGQRQSQLAVVEEDANGKRTLRRVRRTLAARRPRPLGSRRSNPAKPPACTTGKRNAQNTSPSRSNNLDPQDDVRDTSMRSRSGIYLLDNPARGGHMVDSPKVPMVPSGTIQSRTISFGAPKRTSQCAPQPTNRPFSTTTYSPTVELREVFVGKIDATCPREQQNIAQKRQDPLQLSTPTRDHLVWKTEATQPHGHVPGVFPVNEEAIQVAAARISDVAELGLLPELHSQDPYRDIPDDWPLPDVKPDRIDSFQDTPVSPNMQRQHDALESDIPQFVCPQFFCPSTSNHTSAQADSTTIEAAKKLARMQVVALEIVQRLELEEREKLEKQLIVDRNMAFTMQEEENRARAAASQPPSRDCTVCCESMHPLTFPAYPPSNECTHSADVCPPCLQQWVATKIAANARGAIDCPQCTRRLNHHDIRRACNPETFAKYDRYSMLSVVNDLNNFHWCLRQDCDGGQEQFGAGSNYMKCHACDYEQCLHHRIEWHTGRTCKQYDILGKDKADKITRDLEERETVNFLNQRLTDSLWEQCPKDKCKQKIPAVQPALKWCPKCNTSLVRHAWKQCPSCRVPIERMEGCDRVTCSRNSCRQKFCWICLARWEDMVKKKEMAHAQTCYYRNHNFPYDYD